MRIAWVLSTILAAAPLAAIADPPPTPTVITNPDWREKPTADQLSDQYPAVAQFIGLSGHVTVRCQVTVEGTTENCSITEETPPGLGFGEATLTLAKDFKMRPLLRDGKPVGGAEVTVPLMFRPPLSEAADASPAVMAAVAALAPGGASAGPAASAKSLALARKIVTLNTGEPEVKLLRDTVRAQLAHQFGPKLTPTEQAALDDYADAVAATMSARIDDLAGGYAQLFSEKELADIDAFFESPSGRAWVERSSLYASKVNRDMAGDVAAEARRRFCAQHACPPPPAPVSPPAQ